MLFTRIPPPVRPLRDAELSRAVVAESEDHAAGLEAAAPGLDVGLEQIVVQAHADLGFRPFLQALKASRMEIGKERYDRFLGLAERLGYPLAVVRSRPSPGQTPTWGSACSCGL
ncbi:hypothetical protein [Streptomyces sp. CoH27]|uniref:hypothetical protein n=1 Tax=Streptomyces sp. CoH27 TaxID=2875763 RepID=UPI001CD1A601|nr:hypothetical protein [Streptomyces sp. CoH27]